ncbi:MAG: hypothetical protein RL660_3107 [Bacteroidota bacterium]|jgi:hypothetical protein
MKFLTTLYTSALLLVFSANAQVLSVPSSATRNVADLGYALEQGTKSDLDKVNAIFTWVTANMKGETKTTIKRKDGFSPNAILKRRVATPFEYCILVEALCKEMNLKSAIISGYKRDWKFDTGDTLYSALYYWNAVSIGGEWHFMDCYLGSGSIVPYKTFMQRLLAKISKNAAEGKPKFRFEKKYDASHLMPDPETYRLTTIADDPVWQLTDVVMPLSVFVRGQDSIEAFNQTSNPQRRNPALDRFAEKDAFARARDSEPRILEFNAKNSLAISERYYMLGIETSRRLLSKTSNEEAEANVEDVEASLTKAKELLIQAKKDEAKNYQAQRTKNLEKKKHYTQYQQSIEQANRTLLASIKQHTKAAKIVGTKVNAARKQVQAMQADIARVELQDVATMSNPIPSTSDEANKLRDSVNARNTQLSAQTTNIANMKTSIRNLETQQKVIASQISDDMDSTFQNLANCTKARAKGQDHYDEDVQRFEASVTTIRQNSLDSLQKKYLSNMDTLDAMYVRLQTTMQKTAQTFISSLKDIQTYQRKIGGKDPILSSYKSLERRCKQLLEESIELGNQQVSMHNDCNTVLARQANNYAGQNKLLDLCKKIEKQRYDIIAGLLKSEEEQVKKMIDSRKEEITETSKRIRKLKKALEKSQF